MKIRSSEQAWADLATEAMVIASKVAMRLSEFDGDDAIVADIRVLCDRAAELMDQESE